MSSTILSSSVVWVLFLALCQLTFLGCGNTGENEESVAPNGNERLAENGITSELLASLLCAYVWPDDRVTWLSNEESEEARTLLVSLMSQKGADPSDPRPDEMGTKIFYCLSRNESNEDVSAHALVFVVPPVDGRAPICVFGRSSVAKEFVCMARVVSDQRLWEKHLELFHKAADRRDGVAKTWSGSTE